MSKTKSITTIAILIAAVVGLLFYSLSDSDSNDTSVLRAVPEDASLIITTGKLYEICHSINNDNTMFLKLSKSSMLKDFTTAIHFIDTTLQNCNDIRGTVVQSNVSISLHKEGKDKYNTLFAMEIDKNQYKRITAALTQLAKDNGLQCGHEPFDGERLCAILNNKKERLISFAYTNGVLVGSTSKLTVERAILQLHGGNNITHQPGLSSLVEQHSSSTTLYVNYKNLGEILRPELKPITSQSVVDYLDRQASWGAFSLSIGKENIAIQGISTNINLKGSFMKMIEKQEPVSNDFAQYLPTKTASFVSIGISNMKLFVESYISSLRDNNAYNEYEKESDQYRKKYGVDVEKEIYDCIGSRITEFKSDFSLAGQGREQYIVAELANTEKMEQLMSSLSAKAFPNDKSATSNIKSNTGNSIAAYKVPAKRIFSLYFGTLFTCEPQWYACHNGKAVFATSLKNLTEYINCIEINKVLSKNIIYQEFSNELMSSRSNIYYYGDISACSTEIRALMGSNNAKNYAQNEKNFQNFKSAAYQISNIGNNTANTYGAIMYSESVDPESFLMWMAPMDTIVVAKPQVVKNHRTNQNNIVTFDDNCRMYLFDRNGNLIFKKQLPEPVVGQVTQIDMFNNDKYQFLFATESQLHLITINGDYVENFPVSLPDKLSAEISVIDYDGKKDYRIFAPCANKKLYLYTTSGKQLDGWTPMKSDEPLTTPVYYFKHEDRDYLVTADNLKTYILNRKGETRINVTHTFSKSANTAFYLEPKHNRFVTTSSSGEVTYISMNGSCKTKRMQNYTASHHFILRDINGDGENEYIFTDGETLDVFNANGNQILTRCFDTPIGKPNIFKFADKDVRIGIHCPQTGKIYLINNNGDISNGFPMEGTSEFTISQLVPNGRFSIIVGGQGNFLRNYNIP